MEQWTIMFVDVVGSTELKYQEKPENSVAQAIVDLFRIVQTKTSLAGRESIKFTGDGAMIIFRKDPAGCLTALKAAESILQGVDVRNFSFTPPWLQIRIGIATGECYQVNQNPLDVTGKKVDLAARLCAEAGPETILVDDITKKDSRLPEHRFQRCERRLALKGVLLPPDEPDRFFLFKPRRLLRRPADDPHSNGLLALYPNRASMGRELRPARLIAMAAPRSTMLIAGRTLKTWVGIAPFPPLSAEMKCAVRSRQVRFHFLICSEESSLRYLEQKQQVEIQRDYPLACQYLRSLVASDPDHFDVRETDVLLLDGITCAEILLPGGPDSGAAVKLIVLHDINAAAGGSKAASLLACTCRDAKEKIEESCMAHGLYRRTQLIFDKARKMEAEQPRNQVEAVLRDHREGLNSRNNQPAKYIGRMLPYFECIARGTLSEVPAPFCVQAQVSSTCSTDCVMCDHWKRAESRRELSSDDWRKVFTELGDFGVRAVVFSGGEPLVREDLVELLYAARNARLDVALLTNGTMAETASEDKRQELISSLRDSVRWIAISVDGPPDKDLLIRKKVRLDSVRNFCRALQEGPKRPTISATVTLQTGNIAMDLTETCRYIHEDLCIPRVDFKLASGAWRALSGPRRPEYLLREEQLSDLTYFLRDAPLPEDEGSDLAYLRRCFAGEVFHEDDCVNGEPVYSFYREHSPPLRCFTPFLFSLIDSNGDVYPCCYLYRDNHGADPASRHFRLNHRLGNVAENPFSFRKIWNGQLYAKERQSLAVIDPTQPDFLPCGECTRHCQHNIVLTELYDAYGRDISGVGQAIQSYGRDEGPVWF